MAFITKDEVKEFLGITDTNSDALLDVLAVRACTMLESLCNRKFEQATFAEKFIGNDKAVFYAPNLPIVFGATESIEIEDSDDLGEDDVIVLEEEGVIELRTKEFPDGKICVVNYKGGFTTVPADVIQAAVEIAALLFNRNKSTGVQSESDGPVSVTYEKQKINEIPSVALVVDFYRISNFA